MKGTLPFKEIFLTVRKAASLLEEEEKSTHTIPAVAEAIVPTRVMGCALTSPLSMAPSVLVFSQYSLTYRSGAWLWDNTIFAENPMTAAYIHSNSQYGEKLFKPKKCLYCDDI